MSSLRLIVGLGNPGKEYEDTRHNIGFKVVENLLSKTGGSKWQVKGNSFFAEITLAGIKVKVLKPQTFMNNSGQPVAELARFYKIAPSELLVVHDELDLGAGVIRLKSGGGDAGHNGLRSMTSSIGSADYIRLRVGIGKPENQDIEITSWVLGKFAPEEKKNMPELLENSSRAIFELAERGLKQAQNAYNKA